MILGIVTGFSFRNAAGLEQFFMDLLESLEAVRPADVTYRIYTGTDSDLEKFLRSKNLSSFEVVHVPGGKYWKQIGLPFMARSDAYLWNGPLVSRTFFPRSSLVLAYDFAYRNALPTAGFKERLRIYAMDYISGFAFRRAQRVIGISQATNDDIRRIFHIRDEKLAVIPPGVRAFDGVTEEKMETPANGYFFFVGTFKERKNVRNLVLGYLAAAKEEITQDLVLAGRMDTESPYVRSITEAVAAAGMEKRVQFLGQVSDGALLYLYRNARAFTFPSAFEG